MTDVLLFNAPVEQPRGSAHAGLHPPLGLGYIAAVLRDAGYSVSARDLNVTGLNPQLIRRVVSRESPAMVGISAHTETYPNGLEIADLTEAEAPTAAVVMGGPHASVTYEQTAVEPAVDYVVRGEGEYAMRDLASVLVGRDGNDQNELVAEIEEIPGLVYESADGNVVATPERPMIENPDELPWPARDLFPLELYEKPGNVLFSRGGCPFSCHFCAVNSIWVDRARRFRDPEAVAQEVEHLLVDHGLRQINFADDTFTLRRDAVLELTDRLEAIEAPFPWDWTCSTRVDLVDRELLERLADAGCSGIQFGVEAGSQEILDATGKNITLDQAREAVSGAAAFGMDVLASFMFPHPDDTESSIRQQAEFMKEIRELGADISIAFTTPYPGTAYAEMTAESDLEVAADEWNEYDAKHLIMSTRNLSFSELEELFEELVRDVGLKRRVTA